MLGMFGKGVGEIIGTYAVSQVKSYMTQKEVATIEEKESLVEDLEAVYESRKNFNPGIWGKTVSALSGCGIGFPAGYSITAKRNKPVTNG